jgi:glycerate kinase
MKVVLAPNPLKGSLTAREACEAMKQGVRLACPGAVVEKVPFADGRDGLVEGLADIFAGRRIKARISGPAKERVSVHFCHVPDRALAGIEAAQASGLGVRPSGPWDPQHTSTYGVGQLIRGALKLQVRRVVMGVAGVAANDGGVGMASALGARFLDSRGRPVRPVGAELHRIRRIDTSSLDRRLKQVHFEVMCDEDTPLLGKHGATMRKAQLKGLSPREAEFLEGGMVNLASMLHTDLGVNVRDLAGAGAGGGLAAGLHAFLGAELRHSAEAMLELAGLEEALQEADLVLTTEGSSSDGLSPYKGPEAVAACAGKWDIPCVMLAGTVDPLGNDLAQSHLTAAISICPGPVSLATAIENAETYLKHSAEQVLRIFSATATLPPEQTSR